MHIIYDVSHNIAKVEEHISLSAGGGGEVGKEKGIGIGRWRR